jgi:hypothetical protein
MELAALQSFISGRCSGLIGLPTPARTSPFPTGPAVFHRLPSPTAFAVGSSSPELRASFRVLRFVPAPPLSSRSPFLGVCPPLRYQTAESTYASIPSSLRSVHRVSHPLDGLLLHRPCGSISPRNHIRGSPFRGFPSDTAAPPRRWHVPSCRLAVPPTACLRKRRQNHGPSSRALIRIGVRCVVQGFSLYDTRSPPELHLLQVSRTSVVSPPSRRLRS